MANASPIRCLITAGPTREFLDPVRFLSNPSTGKMGFALAEAAVAAGWTVDLVAGPVALPEPEDAILYPVVTADEMLHQVDALFDACDVLLMCAAVSDFRPAHASPSKAKKEDAPLTLELERTVDILESVAPRKNGQLVVGFAAETENVEAAAREKRARKRLDWIVANRVGQAGAGFGADDNRVLLIGGEAEAIPIGPASKRAVADDLIARFRSGSADG